MGKISVKEGMKEGLWKVHVFGGCVCVGGWGGIMEGNSKARRY